MTTLRTALLFGFGLSVSLYYGRRGYMPLDQSIVFDGAWRILSGEVPFRDYVAPNGFVVHALQALFFGAFGVSWFVYVLHAAIVNGLFALLAQRVLVLLGCSAAAAFAFALASALVLYPPVGVPFMDSHAFFFSAVGLWLALEARRREAAGRDATGRWLLLPVAMACAAGAKQIPSAFVLPIVLVLALAAPPGRSLARLARLTAGSAGIVAALVAAGWLAGVDPALLRTYFFALPAAEAPKRLADAAAIGDELRGTGMASLASVQLALAAVLLAGRPARRLLGRLALAESLLAVGIAFAWLTINQKELSVAYVFLATGIAYGALAELRGEAAASRGARRTAAVASVALACVAAWDAWDFHVRVNTTRAVDDIQWTGDAAGPAEDLLPAELGFLQWQVPPVVPYDARDFGEVAAFLASQERGFLLIGDASVLYGLTGKASAAPSLWFHPGLTVPPKGSPEMRRYEDWLLARIADLDVRFLVLEGRHTWNHFAITDLPRVAAMVRTGTGPRLHFGGFRVVDLAPGPPGPPGPPEGPTGDQDAGDSRASSPTTAAESLAPRAASDSPAKAP